MSAKAGWAAVQTAISPSSSARATAFLVEAMIPVIARDPVTVSGAGVTWVSLETAIAATGKALVTAQYIESLVSFSITTSSGTSSPATRATGHAT